MMPPLTPVKAARAKCLTCVGGKKAVRECPRGPESQEPCALHPFRMGRNPARKGIGRAMSSEDARSCRKRTTQDDGFATNSVRSGEGTGETGSPILGDPRAKSGRAKFPPPVLLPRRVLGKAVEAFVRELRDGGVQVEDPSDETTN